MSDQAGQGTWVIWLGVAVLVLILGLLDPLWILVVLCFGFGGLLLFAAFTKRRPLEKQSPPILPEEVQARIWESLLPGKGDWFLRMMCISGAVMFLFIGIFALADVLDITLR